MNRNHIPRYGVAMLTIWHLLSAVVCAEPPLPSFRYYGMLSDEYGWPVLQGDHAVIVLKKGTNECARFTANELLGNGVNFVLEAPVDNVAGPRYARYAVRTGDALSVSVLVDGVEQSLIGGTSIPVVGNPGDAVRADINLGTDADHDGLSDEWEMALIVNNSGGLYTNIYDVLPGDDFDGDHVSNLDEFRAGTAPEWDGDVFEAYKWMMNTDGMLALCFYTKRGMSYEVLAAPKDLSGRGFAWKRIPFHTSPGSGESLSCTAGSSSRTFFYVMPTNSFNMYRLEITR